MTDPSGRLPGVVVRALLVVAFAVVALFASRSAAAATTPLDVVDCVSAVRITTERAAAIAPITGDVDPDAFEEALDDDDIDDDDVEGRFRSEVYVDAAVPVHSASSPRKPALASRTEPQRDPSRFAIGHGFARGPPV